MENNINFESLNYETLVDLWHNQNSDVIREIVRQTLVKAGLWKKFEYGDDNEQSWSCTDGMQNY